jgi:alanyl-tRNA synthetase
MLTKLLGQASKRKEKRLSGEDVFLLYDTYGFPDELTRLIAKKERIDLDETGFQTLLEGQRKRAKSSSKLVPSIFTAPEMNQELVRLPAAKFIGYSTLEGTAKVLWRSISGQDGMIVLDETPFYPEGGGQSGDSGILSGEKFEFQVSDTQKRERVIVHYGTLLKGRVEPGDECRAQVNADLRHATKRNHTATHLLQAALRSVLGTHVRQVGSLVNPEKLRFDFTHGQALTADEIKNVERWVNQTVLENREVQPKFKRYEEAVKEGVLAFFGDKYEDEVRVIEVPDRSKELCGGTHCRQTGEIGAFVITSETSVGSGIRRIEAITGMNAVEYMRGLKESLNRIANILNVHPSHLIERVEKLELKIRELEKTGVKHSVHDPNSIDLESWIRSAEEVGKIQFIWRTLSNERIDYARHLADRIRKMAKNTVLALFATADSKVSMIIALSEDLADSKLDAKQMAQAASVPLKGSAGGRKDLAQGGGQEESGIDQAVNTIREHIKNAAEVPCK